MTMITPRWYYVPVYYYNRCGDGFCFERHYKARYDLYVAFVHLYFMVFIFIRPSYTRVRRAVISRYNVITYTHDTRLQSATAYMQPRLNNIRTHTLSNSFVPLRSCSGWYNDIILQESDTFSVRREADRFFITLLDNIL